MRMMARVTIPNSGGNKAISEGKLGQIVERTLSTIKPEASYFTTYEGSRTMFLFFDMADSSNMPLYFEPLFSGLDAKVELVPVMSVQELQSGLQKAGVK